MTPTYCKVHCLSVSYESYCGCVLVFFVWILPIVYEKKVFYLFYCVNFHNLWVLPNRY